MFPAQGITYDDNYFSHVEPDSSRRHIGICPQEFPVKVEIRTISQLIISRIVMVRQYLQKQNIDILMVKKLN